ncbi:uncharacterized protein METZ01_LOCUS387802 [marine metagenome]|uniref:SHOCT domain-containing protein n=1 Tax=marine metagenome TaxID=408172 RepID=A0A382UML4_9ZZZZ
MFKIISIISLINFSIVPVLFAQDASLDEGTETVIMFVLGAIVLTIYWSFRGLIGLFQRHNAILVIIYLIIIFPIAYIHMLLLGIFGDSSKKRKQDEIDKEVEIQTKVHEKVEKNIGKKETASKEIVQESDESTLEKKLDEIKNLKEKGLINDEEYEEKKKKIIEEY